ncbi:hypothetical protein DDW08_00920 [Vulcanisaeta sp. SCGC AB-777_J10]|nr:hypothetical protein DDW08_00920 [Vulcanisaeta sp. SCGC AB-777_J10]
MNVLAFIITTIALLGLAVFYIWYLNTYISTNLLNTAGYTLSLVSSALIHEFQNAISVASMGNVVGTFNYTLMLPTSAIPVQGMALTYTITLYSKNSGNNLALLYANITVTMAMGSLSRSVMNKVLIYSSTQPYTITAYNCVNVNNGTVILISPGLNSMRDCTWTSAQIQMGDAIISITK